MENEQDKTNTRIKVDGDAILVGEGSKKYCGVPKEYFITDDGYAISEEQAEELMFESTDYDYE